MISKVKSVQPNGSFQNDFGAIQDNPDLPNHGKKLLYKFEYEMEDETVITANHKTNTSPFPAGTEVEYEVKKDDPNYGKSGSVKKPETSTYNGSKSSAGNDAVQLMIVRQSSLKCALDLIRHNAIGNDKQIKADTVEALADKFTAWVMRTEKPQNATEQLMDDNNHK